MANETLFTHRQRGGTNDGQYGLPVYNELGEIIVAGGNLPYAEVTRQGRMYSVQTATPFAPIVALPTTLAKLEVKNNKLGYAMVIDCIWSWQLLGTAVVWAHTPWAQVGAAVVSANAALVMGSGDGGANITSALTTDAVCAVDQTVVASGWRVFPGSTMAWGLAAATPGGANVGQVDGRLVVPYGKSVHVCVSGSVATASSMHCGVSWTWQAITPV